jgi:hypothetical protein
VNGNGEALEQRKCCHSLYSVASHECSSGIRSDKSKPMELEECRLLGYKNPVRTSQETHYVSTAESSRLNLHKFVVFTELTIKCAVFWDVTPCDSCKNRRFGGKNSLYQQIEKISGLETTLRISSN